MCTAPGRRGLRHPPRRHASDTQPTSIRSNHLIYDGMYVVYQTQEPAPHASSPSINNQPCHLPTCSAIFRSQGMLWAAKKRRAHTNACMRAHTNWRGGGCYKKKSSTLILSSFFIKRKQKRSETKRTLTSTLQRNVRLLFTLFFRGKGRLPCSVASLSARRIPAKHSVVPHTAKAHPLSHRKAARRGHRPSPTKFTRPNTYCATLGYPANPSTQSIISQQVL